LQNLPEHNKKGERSGREGTAKTDEVRLNKLVQNSLTFAAMTLILFSGTTILIWRAVLSDPEAYFQLGLTGWLTLHRETGQWSFDHVEFVALVIELGFSLLFAWILASMSNWLRRMRQKSNA